MGTDYQDTHLGKDSYHLRSLLTSCNHELNSARVKESQLNELVKLLSGTSNDFENRILLQERKICDFRCLHAKSVKESGRKIEGILEDLWNEKRKNAIIELALKKEKESSENLNVELKKGAALNANLREALVAQHRLREEVIGKLQRSLQESKRYILRLEEDAIEADKARGMMEKNYTEKLAILQRSNDRNAEDLQGKTAETEELKEQLEVTKQHLAQFNADPTAQFKLISDLYGAYVACEKKVIEMQRNERLLDDQKKEMEKFLFECTDELCQLRSMTKDYAAAMEAKQTEVDHLKLAASPSEVIVERSVSSSVSDVEAMSRELALYRSQSSDPQVNQFISMVAKDCKLFNRLRSSTFSETVLWTFVADHSVESQVKEIQRLKSALRLSKEEVEFLQAQIERLQKFDLPVELTNAGTESDNNTTVDVMKERVRVYEQEKVEGALNYEKLSALYAECSGDLDRMLTEHQDVVQANLQREHDYVEARRQITQLSTEIAESSHRIHCITVECESLRSSLGRNMEMDSAEGDGKMLDSLRQEIASAREELDSTRREIEYCRENAPLHENISGITEERDAFRRELRGAQAKIAQLESNYAALVLKNEASIKARDHSVYRLENEMSAHRASTESLSGLRSQFDSANSVISACHEREKHLTAALENTKESFERREKALNAEVLNLTQQVDNSEKWRESYYQRLEILLRLRNPGEPVDTGTVIKHLRTEVQLLKAEVGLWKNEYEVLTSAAKVDRATINRLEEIADLSGSASDDPVGGEVWKERYAQKRDLLTVSVENGKYLRQQIADFRCDVEELRSKVSLGTQEIDLLLQRIGLLETENSQLRDDKVSLEDKLESSNRRYDADEQRKQIESLKKDVRAAEIKKSSEMDKMKTFYTTQRHQLVMAHNEALQKYAEQLKARDAEIGSAREELRRISDDFLTEIGQLRSENKEAFDTSEARNADLTAQMEKLHKDTELADLAKTAMVNRYKRDSELAEEHNLSLRQELHEAKEKVLRLEAAATSLKNIQAFAETSRSSVTQPMADIIPTTVSSGTPRRPVGSTLPMPSLVRSTAVVIPQTHPVITVQRVTPQLRQPDVPVHSVAPHTLERQRTPTDLVVPTTSSAATVPVVHEHGVARSTVQDFSTPSTSSGIGYGTDTTSQKRGRSDMESSHLDNKRRRESSPNTSDVSSSTNAARNSLGSVGSASLLRARANSRSSGTVIVSHTESHTPHGSAEHQFQRNAGFSGAADIQPHGTVSSIEETNFVTESTDAQPAEPDLDYGGNQEMEEEDETPSEQFGDYDTDESNQGVQPSDALSPLAPVNPEDVTRDQDSYFPDEVNGVGTPDEVAPSTEIIRPSVPVESSSLDTEATSSSAHQYNASPLTERSFSRVTIVQSGSYSGLFPPRTPFPGGYDAGEDGYGVVPSTPKLLVPRREDEASMLPQVPSFFFGNIAEAVEDVTASQVPPTPFQGEIVFFGQQSGNVSEDSDSSFPAADDNGNPFPSGSRAVVDSRSVEAEDIEIAADDGQAAEIDAGPESMDDHRSIDFTAVDPAVPSPGSMESVEAVEGIDPPVIVHQSGMLSAMPGRPSLGSARRRGNRRPAASVSARSLQAGGSQGISTPSSSSGPADVVPRVRKPISAPGAISSRERNIAAGPGPSGVAASRDAVTGVARRSAARVLRVRGARTRGRAVRRVRRASHQ